MFGRSATRRSRPVDLLRAPGGEGAKLAVGRDPRAAEDGRPEIGSGMPKTQGRSRGPGDPGLWMGLVSPGGKARGSL